MKSICLYFQVHQPYRIKPYTFFDLGQDHNYFDEEANLEILNKVSEKCYLPANKLFLSLINQSQGKLKIAFSLSGVFLDQIVNHRPDVLASFKLLAKTGCVEFLSETYYHSLASVYSQSEFEFQIQLHKEKVESLFGQTPRVFRNTELIYNDQIVNNLDALGFEGVLAEGTSTLLGEKSMNQLFKTDGQTEINTLARNFERTDDVAFRFSDSNWINYPLTPLKFKNALLCEKGELINLFMDYETIGEHHWEATGIFNFWEDVLNDLLNNSSFGFSTPSQVIDDFDSTTLPVSKNTTSWADSERDLSAWCGNEMQQEAIERLYSFEGKVKSLGDDKLLTLWRRLQTSDHFYYMSTKHYGDGAVHGYFSPFSSPYDAYIFYMNVLADFELELDKK